jgi:hypothetical protein
MTALELRQVSKVLPYNPHNATFRAALDALSRRRVVP